LNFARNTSYILFGTVQQVRWYYNLKFHNSAILLSDRKVLIYFLKKPWPKHRVETVVVEDYRVILLKFILRLFSSEICKCDVCVTVHQ